MELTTPVKIEPLPDRIKYSDKILLLGSCFADEIGALLDYYRFRVLVNPFGTLYNPVSVISSLERLASAREFTPDDVVENQGIYATFYHHSDFADSSPERFLKNANEDLRTASAFFREAGTVIITLGTAWTYRHLQKNIIVSNCRKIPQNRFSRELLTANGIAGLLRNFIRLYPDKKYIFTVSPIRHLKDGAHGNQISKAILLLAVEELLTSFSPATGKKPFIYYFPAYEIMMDELRDYRFYAEDMTHPSPQAVRYIFRQFREFCIDPREYPLMHRVENLEKALRHTPLFPDSESGKDFLKKRKDLQEKLEKEYPQLSRHRK